MTIVRWRNSESNIIVTRCNYIAFVFLKPVLFIIRSDKQPMALNDQTKQLIERLIDTTVVMTDDDEGCSAVFMRLRAFLSGSHSMKMKWRKCDQLKVEWYDSRCVMRVLQW